MMSIELIIAIIFVLLLLISGLVKVFAKIEDQYYIEEVKDGFSTNYYIYRVAKVFWFGDDKRYVIDGYTEGYKTFPSEEAAKEYIDKLPIPKTIKTIKYP